MLCNALLAASLPLGRVAAFALLLAAVTAPYIVCVASDALSPSCAMPPADPPNASSVSAEDAESGARPAKRCGGNSSISAELTTNATSSRIELESDGV
uniref:Uncharacterized protein n=1 Tax=Zooxanthella nutricula TaxID=1333877 RepID=A0A7S2KSG7_9DINO